MRSERTNLRKSTANCRRAALRDCDYRSMMLCVWEHKPAAPSRVAARLQGCRVLLLSTYCAPPARTARGSQGRPTHSRGRPACRCERASAPPAGRHTCVRPGRRGQQQQACGWEGGWAHLARPTEGHSVGEEQRVEALVARHGAVKRGGRVQEGNRLGLLLPGDRMGLREACGASALLLPWRTARAFQRLTDLHDDGAAASAALQAGGLVRHSRVSDESQHCCGKRANLGLFC